MPSFFRSFRETLLRLAPTPRAHPRMVLLTPGPYNETYFEHSYLARYLGLLLVQGGDLTVRDSRVYLKTLEGLKPVDVILRRVDDSFCDPIELRSDSYLGVAGLVEAVRAGNVAVANALGSGLIETSAFMPFLPGLSRRMLGEELKLPAVATWWCGQPDAFRYVRENLDFLVVKPAFPSKGMEPVFGGKLAGAERSQLLERFEARPHEFVGQELLHLSTVPVWSETGPYAASGCSARVSGRPRGLLGGDARRTRARFFFYRLRQWFPCSAAAAARTPGFFRTGR